MDSKFIHIKFLNGLFEVSGDHHLFLGHKINSNAESTADGIFVEWNWNGESLILRTCRYGLYPVYYFVSDREICISTSLVCVLERTRALEIDDIAISVFLRLGFYLDNDTPFKNIRAVPPGVVLHWTPHSLIIEEKDISTKLSHMSRDEAIDRYVTLFRASIEKRVPKAGFALPLSGGRDSRHIFLELCRIDRKPDFCLTAEYFPPRPNEDMKVAKRLAEAYGVNHIVVYQENSYVDAVLRKNYLTDFCSDEHTWALPAIDFLNGRVNTIYDGIGGDVLSAGLFLSAKRLEYFGTGRLEELAKDVLWPKNETSVEHTLTTEAYQTFSYQKASMRLLSVLERYVDQPNPVSSFFFWNRTRREIALYTCGMFSHEMTIFCPYLDIDLFDHLTSLPCEMFLDKQFHTETIAKAFPDNEFIPYGLQDTDEKAQRWSRLKTRRFYTRLAADLGRYLYHYEGEKYVNKRFVLPRLICYLIDGDARRVWFDPEKVIYLIQLERTIESLR